MNLIFQKQYKTNVFFLTQQNMYKLKFVIKYEIVKK